MDTAANRTTTERRHDQVLRLLELHRHAAEARQRDAARRGDALLASCYAKAIAKLDRLLDVLADPHS
jgi:hypothetical protein